MTRERDYYKGDSRCRMRQPGLAEIFPGANDSAAFFLSAPSGTCTAYSYLVGTPSRHEHR